MIDEALIRRVDELEEACKSANDEFDYLVFEAEAIPPSDFRDILAAQLGFMRDELAVLALDLRTPLAASATTTGNQSSPDSDSSGVSGGSQCRTPEACAANEFCRCPKEVRRV